MVLKWGLGSFSGNKVNRLAHFNATEAGRMVWETLYETIQVVSTKFSIERIITRL